MTKIVNSIEMAESKINQALIYVDEKNYTQARELIEEAYKFFQDENLIDGISICLSLIAFLNYSEDKNGYENALELLNDATFMSKRSNNESAILINELMLGNINFSESNKDIALIHYNNALKIAVEDDKYSLVDTINTRIRQLQNGMDYSLPTKSDPLVSLVHWFL